VYQLAPNWTTIFCALFKDAVGDALNSVQLLAAGNNVVEKVWKEGVVA
jgi:hypothetical protein